MMLLKRLSWLSAALVLTAFNFDTLPKSGGRVEGCGYLEPVLVAGMMSSAGSGSWRLPLAPDRPDVLTHARFALSLKEPTRLERGWIASIEVSFPDPKPFGIPFSFEKLELAWMDSQGAAKSALLDWSQECSSPGRSLYPGQRWSQEWELPGTEQGFQPGTVEIRLWGSRN
jgi:hypothetical protein